MSETSIRRPRCWVHRADGASLLVRGRTLMFGRRLDCDIVLDDPRASQCHSLLTPTLEGLELIAIGRNPTKLNGTAITGRTLLSDGDELEMPGGSFRVEVGVERGFAVQAWWLEHPDGQRYAIRQLPYTVGGGSGDHLRVPGWPPGALTFHVAQGALAMEFAAEGTLNGEHLLAGAVEACESGDLIAVARTAIRVQAAEPEERHSTVLVSAQPEIAAVVFTFMPNGGRVSISYGAGDPPVVVQLSELRARLVAVLLAPPGGYEAGDDVPDEVLVKSIWPGQPGRGRVDLNVLLHRTRKDLLKAGLNPTRVLERARKGGSARFRLGRGARVTVE